MELKELGILFNRALNAFSIKKLLLVYATLICAGLFFVFFQGLGHNSGFWVKFCLALIPVYLTIGLLLPLGVFLVRIYHDEVRQRPVSYTQLMTKSWDIILSASYFSIPLVLAFLVLWFVLGIYLLLSAIPGIGEFLGVILAFVPFLLILASLLLCAAGVVALFFMAPILALREFNRQAMLKSIVKRLQNDFFSHLILIVCGLLPFAFLGGLVCLSASLMELGGFFCLGPVSRVLFCFFVMIPMAAVLTPGVAFFFNFAAEAHHLLQKGAQTTD